MPHFFALMAALARVAAGAESFDFDPAFSQRFAEHLRGEAGAPLWKAPDHRGSRDRVGNAPETPWVRALEGIFSYFEDYVNEFVALTDQNYSNLGDFQFVAVNPGKKRFFRRAMPVIEAWQTTAGGGLGVRLEGGAAGIRYDYGVSKRGKVSVTVLPLAVEQLTFFDGASLLSYGSELFYGHAVEAESSYVFSEADPRTEEGAGEPDGARARIFYEPRIFSFGRYRVYAEAYARFSLYKRSRAARGAAARWLRLEEVKIIPKAVYSNLLEDRGRYEPAPDFAFFTKLEFRFRND